MNFKLLAGAAFIAVLLLALFYGDPDLWDMLRAVSHVI